MPSPSVRVLSGFRALHLLCLLPGCHCPDSPTAAPQCVLGCRGPSRHQALRIRAWTEPGRTSPCPGCGGSSKRGGISRFPWGRQSLARISMEEQGWAARREKDFFFHLKAFRADEIACVKAGRCEMARGAWETARSTIWEECGEQVGRGER